MEIVHSGIRTRDPVVWTAALMCGMGGVLPLNTNSLASLTFHPKASDSSRQTFSNCFLSRRDAVFRHHRSAEGA
jgi:hypothetical protein